MSNQTNNMDKKQQLKKYLVFGLMFLAFAASIWLIFAPSEKDKQKKQQGIGLNDEIPLPMDEDITEDKRSAYEQERLRKRQDEGILTLNDYSYILETEKREIEEAAVGNELFNDNILSSEPESAIKNSVSSYQDINRSLGDFYTTYNTSEQEQEMLALEWRIQELEKKLEEKETRQSAMNEQLELMERSYELAAKYMPQHSPYDNSPVTGPQSITPSVYTKEKSLITPVKQAADPVVSFLPQNYEPDDLMKFYNKAVNTGFHAFEADNAPIERNTIKACIHNDQTIMSGQSVFIRLLEPVRLKNSIIPKNAILTGSTSLQGERLNITVSSIEYDGYIHPVKISVYDNDGMKGIYIPALMEIDALKEMIANMGTNMGTSLSITDNAGSQIAADLSRGVIQGTSQLFSKKVRMVKVNLKAGHNLLLFPENK